jgi:hypothetical protein
MSSSECVARATVSLASPPASPAGVSGDRSQIEQHSREERRQRGRPRLADDTSALSLRLPASLHDRLVKAPFRRGELVGDTHRRFLEAALLVEELLFVSRNSDAR